MLAHRFISDCLIYLNIGTPNRKLNIEFILIVRRKEIGKEFPKLKKKELSRLLTKAFSSYLLLCPNYLAFSVTARQIIIYLTWLHTSMFVSAFEHSGPTRQCSQEPLEPAVTGSASRDSDDSNS